MEIGKRLMEEKSRYKELNEISAKEYLEKAGQCSKKWIFNGTLMN